MAGKPSSTSVIRLFGISAGQVAQVLRRAEQRGCPGLRLLGKEDEFAVCIRAVASTAQAAESQCRQWERTLVAAFGSAVYGTGDTDLPRAVLQTLLEKNCLVVAADRATGDLLNTVWQPLRHSEAVYDFGNQSWGEPEYARHIEVPDTATEACFEDSVLRGGWLADSARRVSGADLAVCSVAVPAQKQMAVLVTDGRKVWSERLAADASRGMLTNHLLDLLRRVVLRLELPETIVCTGLDDAPAEEEKAERSSPLDRELERFTLSNIGLSDLAAEMPRKVSDTYERALNLPPELKTDEIREPVAAQNTDLHHAVRRIYNDDYTEEELPDLAEHRRRQRRNNRDIVLWLLFVLICLAGIAAAVLFFFVRSNTARLPDADNYGTALFDTAAQEYTAASAQKDAAVTALLAAPGMDAALVYDAAAQEEQEARCWVQGEVQPGTPLSNAVIYCAGTAARTLQGMDQLETLQANSGFTVYQGGNSYVYKVVYVLYAEDEETQQLVRAGSLVNYLDYASFTDGLAERSLFSIPVDVGETDSFVTLIVPHDSGELAVVGRQVRAEEDSALVPSAIEAR